VDIQLLLSCALGTQKNKADEASHTEITFISNKSFNKYVLAKINEIKILNRKGNRAIIIIL
jgi:hypothetical protein